ncbi:PREDICTED: putative phospholipase B-like 2 [Amphimedon queenslandica]|uniref:Phospholipase B-like n=1 Tax=Amphimedon queenslandica TaxID=400682 RepID=A0A1X7V135_AMPQE|nr:PREDICTED: putative phospholipase B-like 2 [Amphimedon queenslandica]|eukprot:XP_003386071.2 PREDICTED: putative phospholipase B-like 2 [Amphimedon queenslandica]
MLALSYLLVSLLLSPCFGDSSTISVIRDAPWKFRIVEGNQPEAALVSTFNNTVNETGWSLLEIHGHPDLTTDEEMAYMAGYAEGVHTGELIYMTYTNTLGTVCKEKSSLCDKLQEFLNSNIKFLKDNIASNPKSDYWKQINLYLRQLEGLEKGYYSSKKNPTLPPNAFFYLQYDCDMEDLQEAFTGSDSHRVLGDGSCSAIIKVLPNNEDLFTTHDTWSEYQTMLRVFKLYDLPYRLINGGRIPGSSISFSSYPGKLQSEDDYYIMSSRLVTMETTNGIMNKTLWDFISPQSVLEPVRVMVSNRLASSGEEWCKTFKPFNSGTYNNQWMIVNYNHFTPGQALPSSDLLWVLEQIPGTIVYDDQTKVLQSTSYWASYNVPYYTEIFNLSGYPGALKQYGNFFSHDKTARALIFARNHSQVTDMDSLHALMRYNNFQFDPLSACNCTPPYSGEYAISARSDLNPANGTYPIPALKRRCHGGTDNKLTNSEMVKSLSCLATSGPTHSQQPVFKWSTSGFQDTPPLGHPDEFDFAPIVIKWGEIN